MLQENTIFEKALKVEMKDLFVDLRRNKVCIHTIV